MLTCAPRWPSRKVEVRVDRLAAAREADREPPRHRVEEERAVALGAVGAPHRLARPRRHEDLRLDARDGDVRAHRRLRRQHAAARQRHVRGEAHALLHGAQLVDDAVEVDVLAVRQRRTDVHHVVELQVALTDRRRSRRRAASRRPALFRAPALRASAHPCRAPALPSRASCSVQLATAPPQAGLARAARARRAARSRSAGAPTRDRRAAASAATRARRPASGSAARAGRAPARRRAAAAPARTGRRAAPPRRAAAPPAPRGARCPRGRGRAVRGRRCAGTRRSDRGVRGCRPRPRRGCGTAACARPRRDRAGARTHSHRCTSTGCA